MRSAPKIKGRQPQDHRSWCPSNNQRGERVLEAYGRFLNSDFAHRPATYLVMAGIYAAAVLLMRPHITSVAIRRWMLVILGGCAGGYLTYFLLGYDCRFGASYFNGFGKCAHVSDGFMGVLGFLLNMLTFVTPLFLPITVAFHAALEAKYRRDNSLPPDPPKR